MFILDFFSKFPARNGGMNFLFGLDFITDVIVLSWKNASDLEPDEVAGAVDIESSPRVFFGLSSLIFSLSVGSSHSKDSVYFSLT